MIIYHDVFLHIDPLKKCDYQGDGYCDDSNNNAGCDFDGGDCCPTENQFCSECWCPNNYKNERP